MGWESGVHTEVWGTHKDMGLHIGESGGTHGGPGGTQRDLGCVCQDQSKPHKRGLETGFNKQGQSREARGLTASPLNQETEWDKVGTGARSQPGK